MKGANLGFALVFFKILAQGPSIYRGFGSMILCACRTPSPSFPIRWGLGFDRFPLRFWLGTATPGSVCYPAWGRRRSGLGGSWAMRERSQGRLGWANREVSVHGHILGLKPFVFSKLFLNLQITLNSTRI
jgi:hypothetical protein